MSESECGEVKCVVLSVTVPYLGNPRTVCCHGWKGTIKAEFVISNLEATRTWDFGNAPGEVELGGASWYIHVKDDTLDVIECYEARLAAQGARTDSADSLVGAVPRLASVRAAVENSELDMPAAFLKGLLTSIPMKPPPRIADNSEITCSTDDVV